MFPSFVYGWWAVGALWLLVGLGVQLRRRGFAAITRSSGVDPEPLYDAARRVGARGTSPTADGEGFELERDGRTFRITASHFDKRGPTRVYLGTEVRRARGGSRGSAFRDEPATADALPALPEVVLRAETAADAFGKRVGINAEVQTGDAVFDRAIYVEHGADRPLVVDLLARAELRVAVLEIVDARTAIVANQEGQALALRWHPDDAPSDTEALRAAMRTVTRLAETWPAAVDATVRRRNRLRELAVRGSAVVATAIVMGLCGYQVSEHRPVAEAYVTAANVGGATLLLVAVATSWVVARRSARGLARFFWLVAMALAALPAIAAGSLAALNSWGQSERHAVSTRVVRAFQKARKNGFTCHVELAPWRPGMPAPETSIPCGTYGLATTLPAATLEVGRGRLGWEWIEELQLVPTAPTRARARSDDGARSSPQSEKP